MTAVIAFIVAIILAASGLFYLQQPAAPQHSVQDERRDQTTSTLSTINKSGQGLTSISKNDVLAMTNAQVLDLSNNQLTGALPAEIRQLSNLEVLNISENRMTGLPAEIGQLTKLRILNAANNQLTGIPHEIGNLQNLEVLNLSGNDVSEFDLSEIRKRLPSSVEIIL